MEIRIYFYRKTGVKRNQNLGNWEEKKWVKNSEIPSQFEIKNLKDKRLNRVNTYRKGPKSTSLLKGKLRKSDKGKKYDYMNLNYIWETNKHLSYFSQENNFLSRIGDSTLKQSR